MKRIFVKTLVCAASLALAGSMLAFEPPTDEEVRAALQGFMEWYQATPQQELTEGLVRSRFEEAIADIDVSEITFEQAQMLAGYAGISDDFSAALMERMEALAQEQTASGAAARAMLLSQSYPDEQRMLEHARTLFSHPGFEQAVAEGQVDQVFVMIGHLPENAVRELRQEIIGLARFFGADKEVPVTTVGAGAEYVIGLHKHPDLFEHERREEVRVAVLEKLRAATEANPGLKQRLDSQIALLETDFGKGLLIDHPAPMITFNWSSGEELSSLADLQGKVVVLDFWATWCGPCIASFPDIRELRQHFDGYDVAIVGVTSLQERHFPGGGAAPISTQGEPQKEYDLMNEFMESQNMTWTVAFSEQQVFNPEYGVRGIPHVTIIDAEGKVRHNGLHPKLTPLAEKVEKINALLREAGLRTAPQADAPDAADDQGDGGSERP